MFFDLSAARRELQTFCAYFRKSFYLPNMESLILFLVNILGLYVLLGVLFAILFLWKGISQVDPGIEGKAIGLRLLLFPGMVAFWPVFLRKWINTTRS